MFEKIKSSAILSLMEETQDLNKKEQELKQERISNPAPTAKRGVVSTQYVSLDKNGEPTSDPLKVVDVVDRTTYESRKRILL